jgi:hypothetical protein
MTAVILPAGALAGKHMFVKRLQMRIAKAVKENMSINVWQLL